MEHLRYWLLCLLMCALVVSSMACTDAEQRALDRVTNLPGQPPVQFQHYAGYVRLQPQNEKALFYWFIEAQFEPANKPLVLWLTGGPGCSSVAFGALQEVGPFLVRSDYATNLTFNEYSWNKVANLLFVESPVGVGFSYTSVVDDILNLGDQVVANDTLAFLFGWFRKFPDYKFNDFYIIGESYGGHYAPQLANLIYESNNEATQQLFINLKGFMSFFIVELLRVQWGLMHPLDLEKFFNAPLGFVKMENAVINDETDSLGFVEYAWSHAIISDKLYDSIRIDCASFSYPETSAECNNHLRAFFDAFNGIDIYNLYSPVCFLRNGAATTSNATLMGVEFGNPLSYGFGNPPSYDPCVNNYVGKYLSREDVQMALHANVTKLPYPYTICSNILSKWNDSPKTVLPTIQKLLEAGLRIWAFSGDTDVRVPVTCTRYSIDKLELPITEEWRPWYNNRDVGGWVETYDEGFTLATVRGAGHQVPVSARDQSLTLFSHFLTGASLPSAGF